MVFVVAAYFLAKHYEPEVKALLVAELNKNLDVPVQVGDINLSLLSRFPNASLRFADVVIPETSGDPADTLLYVRNLYLQIGLLDFLKKNFTVTEAELNTGFFHMKYHPDGSDNFRFWKESDDSSDASQGGSHINLKDIELVDFGYSLHTADDLLIELFTNKATAEGNFGDEQYTVDAHADIVVKHVASNGVSMYENLHLVGPLSLQMDAAKNVHHFQINRAKLEDQPFRLHGSLDNSGKTAEWRLDASMTSARVERVTQLIPADLRKEFAAYAAEGKTDLDLILEFGESFRMETVFENLRGKFRHTVAMGKAEVKDGAGVLRIDDGKASLYIDQLQGELGMGNLTAKGKIVDFSSPTFDLNLKGNIDLTTLKDFLNIERAEMLTGHVALNGHLTGHLSRGHTPEDKLKLLRGIDFNGSLRVEDGGFKAAGRSETLTDISGDIELKDNAISIQDAGGKINGSSFRIEGSIGNALPYLSEPGQQLHIAAHFSAPILDLNKVWNTESTAQDTAYHFSLPKDVTFNLAVDVDEIKFRKFDAKNVTGKAYFKNDVLTLNPVSFDLASGRVNASLIVNRDGENFRARAMANARGLQIDRVFESFENFGQSVIKSENISGIADLDIDFNTVFGRDLNVATETVQAQADLAVSDGILRNLESLQQIADYIRGNGLWNALIKVDALEKNLKVVTFDDLKNSVVIANRRVTIPEMSLGNSALTMEVMGTHGFDNTIDYALNFRLSELLRTGRQQNEEFGYVVDDGTGLRLFMRMYGSTDSPQFSIDKDAVKDSRKETFQAEKKEIKNILKTEFGLFKSDTTLTGIREAPPTPTTRFEVEWDGDGDRPSDDTPTKTQKPRTKSIFGKNSGKNRALSDEDKKRYEELEKDDDM